MTFEEIVARLTGFSVPIFGISWNPPEADIVKARRIIAFMEDRRVLYNAYELEMPRHCVDSLGEIRAFLTDELQSIDRETEVAKRLSGMRAACRKFMDLLQYHHIKLDTEYPHLGGGQQMVFQSGLGELRGVFGLHLLMLAGAYGLPVEDQLSAGFPSKDYEHTDGSGR